MQPDILSQQRVRVRWLIAGSFTPSPSGRRRILTADDFNQALAEAASGLQVSVVDRLGGGTERRVELSFDKLRAFQVAEVVAAVPELRALRALAEQLSGGGTSDALASRVAEIAGAGRLSSALTSITAPVPTPAPATAPAATAPAAPAPSDDPVDAIFAKADVPPAATVARSAVDAFIRATVSKGGAKPASSAPAQSRTAEVARSMIDEAVLATARDILAHPLVARLEAAWRGLKMLLEQCPSAAGMAIELLDVEPAQVAQALTRDLPEDPTEYPDAVFVVDPVGDLAVLAQLAGAAEDAYLPVVAEVPPALFEAKDAGEVSLLEEEGGRGAPEGWKELRANEACRWLCAATNRVALYVEGKGPDERTCLGSPAFAVAAMLARSYRETGTFVRVVGRPGELRAPAVRQLTSGRDAGVAAPTEVFLSIGAQGRLASLGLLGVGSGRNTDVLVLAAAPMVRAGEQVAPLMAQVLTGRVVRFAQWVRDSLPAGVGREEVAALFSEAANVFLFAGSPGAGRVRAELVPGEGGKRSVQVSVEAEAAYAGMPFQLSFSLPMR